MLLCLGRQFFQRLEAALIDFLLVGHQIVETNPPMRADLTEWNLAVLNQPDQEGARNVQQVGRLLRREFRMDRHQRHGVALRHLRQDVCQQPERCHRNRDALLNIIVGLNAEAKGEVALAQQAGQATAGFLGKPSVGLRGRDGLGESCGYGSPRNTCNR